MQSTLDIANVTSAVYNGVNAIVTASLLPNLHTIYSLTCLALHKTYVGGLLRLIPKTHIVTTFYF